MKSILLGLALAAALSPAAAQDRPGMDMEHARPVCVKAEVVTGFEGWGRGTPAAQLSPGSFARLVLAPAEAVKFSPPLNRAPASDSKGGIYALRIEKMGTYRFALGTGAWIDVIGSKSERLSSVAHRHGPACSGITKIVDYRLEGGDYIVQISATREPTLDVMVIGPVAPF